MSVTEPAPTTSATTSATTPRAASFPALPPDAVERWRLFGRPGFAGTDRVFYPEYLGLTVEEVREGYCRMRMTFRPELMQAGGVVHGGALASLLDSVLVPAIGSTVAVGSRFSTVDLHVQYLEALLEEDCIAEGWIVRQGRRIVFGQAEARAADTGRLVATSVLTYHVSPPPAST
jgi:uncharacterized protein (TIGR00369 family)